MRRRSSISPGMLYMIVGVLIVASAQSVKTASPNAFYAMTGIGALLGIFGLVTLLRSNG